MIENTETPDVATEIANAEYDATQPQNATTIQGVYVSGHDTPVLLGWSVRTGVPGDRTYHLFTRDGRTLTTSPKMRYVRQFLAEALASGNIGAPVDNLEFASLIAQANDKQVTEHAPVEDDDSEPF